MRLAAYYRFRPDFRVARDPKSKGAVEAPLRRNRCDGDDRCRTRGRQYPRRAAYHAETRAALSVLAPGTGSAGYAEVVPRLDDLDP